MLSGASCVGNVGVTMHIMVYCSGLVIVPVHLPHWFGLRLTYDFKCVCYTSLASQLVAPAVCKFKLSLVMT